LPYVSAITTIAGGGEAYARPAPWPARAGFREDAFAAELGPFLDGGFTGGEGSVLVSVDPSTGVPLARIRAAGASGVERAVRSATIAWSLWRRSPLEERRRRLRALARLVRDRAEEIANLVASEQGKPILEALALEVLPALDHLEFVARQAGELRGFEPTDDRLPLYAHKRVQPFFDPIGVVGIVTPYPLPFGLPLVQVASALAMGNAVVLKPSERTTLCGLRLGELCAEAGLPPGLVNVVPGRIEEALALAAHPGVHKVFFAGTSEAGREIMATAGCTLKPVVLSLSGKHAAIVAADADARLAAKGIAWGALANAGQNCGAVERVYVEEAIASRFVELLIEEVDRVRLGHPLAEGTDMGPLVSEARRREVHRQVSEAVAGGAKLLRGGEIPEGAGFYYPPTVVLAPPADCRLLREETLGPVIPVVAVESLERAVLLANATEFPLSASAWTGSAETAERIGAALEASLVTVNDVLYASSEPSVGWSGSGRSGIGDIHGIGGLREMCRRRTVSFDPVKREAPVFAFPYDVEAGGVVRALVRAFHGDRLRGRLRHLARLLASRRFRMRVPVRSFLVSFARRPR